MLASSSINRCSQNFSQRQSVINSCNSIHAVSPVAKPEKEIKFSSNFKAGNGDVKKEEGKKDQYRLKIRPDNKIPQPARYVNWFYVKAINVPTKRPISLTIEGSGFLYNKGEFVYSYGKDWHKFSPDEVQQNSDGTVTITKQFKKSTVSIARSYPYTTDDLNKFIKSIKTHSDVKVSTLGESEKKPVYKITIDHSPEKKKPIIVIYARAHANETLASWITQYICCWLLNSELGKKLREEYGFILYPFINMAGDGGNYRLDGNNNDPERSWIPKPGMPGEVEGPSSAVNLIANDIHKTMKKGGEILHAWNLHASNVENPQLGPFPYGHFSDEKEYTPDEIELFNKQKKYWDNVRQYYTGSVSAQKITPGGRGFLKSPYPETYFWNIRGSATMAMTFEAVYSMTLENCREFARALLMALAAESNKINENPQNTLQPMPPLLQTSLASLVCFNKRRV